MKDQKQQAQWIAVLSITAIALYLCWLMLKPFVGVLAWATVLVIVFYPAHRRLLERIKRPGLAALLSCLLVVLIVILPLTFLTLALGNELRKVVPNLPAQMSQLVDAQTSVLGRASGWIQGRFGIEVLPSQDFIVDQLKRSGEYLLGMSFGLVGNLLGGIVKAFFIVFTMYYLFRDAETIVKHLRAALPFGQKQSEQIFRRTEEVVSASVYGVLTIAVIQGLLGGLAFWVLGVPSPIFWGVLMMFVCMIPLAGSFIVWLPLAIYLILTGHWTKAILLAVWGALVISTIDNLLRPKLMNRQTRLHELLVFFSVLGGLSVFGLLGIVLGPVVLAITLGLLEALRHTQKETA